MTNNLLNRPTFFLLQTVRSGGVPVSHLTVRLHGETYVNVGRQEYLSASNMFEVYARLGRG